MKMTLFWGVAPCGLVEEIAHPISCAAYRPVNGEDSTSETSVNRL
jgi:hypothetical protein